MSDPIRHLSILQSPVFLINSRLDLFTAATPKAWRLFSRSYESILPNSLAMNLSSALEYSSQLPVSVYGTGCFTCFSWRMVSWIITLTEVAVYYRYLSVSSTNNSVCSHQRPIPVTFSVSRYWNINQLSIHYPFRVRVRPRLTPS